MTFVKAKSEALQLTFVKAKSEALQLTFVIMYCFKNKYKAKSEALQLNFVKAKIEYLELTFVKSKSESLKIDFCNYLLLQTQVHN